MDLSLDFEWLRFPMAQATLDPFIYFFGDIRWPLLYEMIINIAWPIYPQKVDT